MLVPYKNKFKQFESAFTRFSINKKYTWIPVQSIGSKDSVLLVYLWNCNKIIKHFYWPRSYFDEIFGDNTHRHISNLYFNNEIYVKELKISTVTRCVTRNTYKPMKENMSGMCGTLLLVSCLVNKKLFWTEKNGCTIFKLMSVS